MGNTERHIGSTSIGEQPQLLPSDQKSQWLVSVMVMSSEKVNL